METTSPWMPFLDLILERRPIFVTDYDEYKLSVRLAEDSLWVMVEYSQDSYVLLRAAYSPSADLKEIQTEIVEDSCTIVIRSSFGIFKVDFQKLKEESLLFRCTTSLTPSHSLLIPFWPRDLAIVNHKRSLRQQGEIHISQTGARSGLQFIGFQNPDAGSLLYFQNLTSLNDYCKKTKTSLADCVGGNWPELGFALPPAVNIPLTKNKTVIISDAYLAFHQPKAKNTFDSAKAFLKLLANIYQYVPKPDTRYHNWPEVLDKGLQDLQFNHACWSHADGNDYLNAYAADYTTPPEIMVQLAVLLPLTDFKIWSKKDLPAIQKIKAGLPSFYDDGLKTIVRWLPSQAAKLNGSEEQLNADVMDSWYLHHPLLNLGRLALQGDTSAKKLFLKSLPFAIKVAKHFKYEWPVFYNIKTLDIIKAETKPGEGGEHDVAGLYSLVMLKAWRLTKQSKYLIEAKQAAKTLAKKKFKMLYQANNTCFAANAMMELFVETKEEFYLNVAYLCLANIFKNVQLWECDYGFAKNYPTFFGVFPLNDAPYTAAYEEQEVFASLHRFLQDSERINILPPVRLLLAEYIRYLVFRAYYYYPGNLPAQMLCDKVKMGEVDRKLWIALEDLHDGWEQSGSVGQEVYGAGVAFGIVPRHYYLIPDENFMLFIDYPSSNLRIHKGLITIHVDGSEKLFCRLLIIKKDDKGLPEFLVSVIKKDIQVDGILTKEGNMEYSVPGNQHISISWKSRWT